MSEYVEIERRFFVDEVDARPGESVSIGLKYLSITSIHRFSKGMGTI